MLQLWTDIPAYFISYTHAHAHTYTQPFYCSLHFVQDKSGEPVPEERFTHSHLSWSSVIPYLLHPSSTIHGIPLFNLRAWQSFSTISLQVFFGLSLGLAPSLHTIIHTFLHPIIVFFSQHMPIPSYCFSVVPRPCHLILASPSTLYLELYLVA